MANAPYGAMANIGFFQIPADDIARARKFYQSLPGWKIEQETTLKNKSPEWQNIITGDAEGGSMNRSGISERMGPGQIMDFVIVEDFDRVLAKVEKLGGRILMPKNSIKSVGFVAVIQDTESNTIGLLKPE